MKQHQSYDTEKLKILLLELYQRASNKIFKAKSNNILRKTPYERINVIEFDFDHETFSYNWEDVEYFDHYDWSSYVFGDFIKDHLKTGAEYEAVVAEICKVFKAPEEATRNVGVNRFLSFIAHHFPNGELNDGNIDFYIDVFIKDYIILLEKLDYTWRIHLWLTGVKFEMTKDIGASNAIIRKPRKHEYSNVRPKLHQHNEFERITGKHLISQCIIEFKTLAPKYTMVGISNEKIESEMESWVDVFRLFKVGNVTIAFQSASPESIMVHPEINNPESPFDKTWKGKLDYHDVSDYKYMIRKKETHLFIKFANKMFPILTNISAKNYFTGKDFDLAFHRYKDALLRSEVNVNRIVSAISSLEALLSEAPGDITFKIGVRVSTLLGFFKFNTLEVYNDVKQAYELRSRLVHGSPLKSNSKDLMEFARKSTHRIVDYSRICLLVALQLRNLYSKESFIKLLNEALINEVSKKTLKKSIKENVIFTPSQFIY